MSSTSADAHDIEMSNNSDNPGPVIGPHPSNLPDGHPCAEGSISTLERLMDESHIQPVGDDGDLDDILCAYETPELSEAGKFESAYQSFDSSYGIFNPYVQNEAPDSVLGIRTRYKDRAWSTPTCQSTGRQPKHPGVRT